LAIGRSPPLRTASKYPPHFPAVNYEQQDETFGDAFSILQKSIGSHVFPAASVSIIFRGKMVALKGLGRFTYQADSPNVTDETIFDLASVSKVVATTAMAMILYERGLLDLDMPVTTVIPEFARKDSRKKDVTFRMLLAHSSGLPAYEKLFLKAQSRDDLVAAAFEMTLTADAGTRVEYSDIGFIILGIALERIAAQTLDHFSQGEIFGRLGMARTAFNPASSWRRSVVPTADDRTFRKRVIQGEVQDENASVMGGVAGHAGVFSTAEDLAIFAHAMLRGGGALARPETIALFTRRESAPPRTSRALGWDTPSAMSQSGKYFSLRSFGHLGYTGTSLWIDPERELSITLLTNRTWPDCNHQGIREVRPRFHDAVVEALEGQA
jgi:CubicO group peptidase (beta-lactamase class C family)